MCFQEELLERKLYSGTKPQSAESMIKYSSKCDSLQKEPDKTQNLEKTKPTCSIHLKPDLELKNEEKKHVSQSFKEILQQKADFDLFKFFAKESLHTYKNYIECFEQLIRYKESKCPTLKKTLSKFILKKYLNIKKSNTCVVFNSNIRAKIMNQSNKTIIECSMNMLFKYLKDILTEEIYPRFLNSSIWWNYNSISSNLITHKNFSGVYHIENVRNKYIGKPHKCLIEINEIKNKITFEKFLSKRITKIDTKETCLSAGGIRHPCDGLIFPIEIFKEKVKNFTIITYVTNGSVSNLDSFIKERNSKYLNSSELMEIMLKILKIVQFYHEKNICFDLNELREDNIYYNQPDGEITIDQGYYNDSYENVFNYWVAPEQQKSGKNDSFALGMIFFHLITLLSIETINNIFQTTEDTSFLNKSFKSLMDKLGLNYLYPAILKTEMLKTKVRTNFLLTDFKKSIDNSLFDVVLKMTDPNPSNRVSIDFVIKKIEKLQSRFNYKPTNENESKFRSFLQVSPNREYFKEFLRHECSIENILFYEDVQIFKSIQNSKTKLSKAREMFKTYLNSDSNLEININGKIKKKFINDYAQSTMNQFISNEIFDDILSQVINVAFVDSFPRFERSSIFQDWKNKS
eukprot:gene10982-3688_t